MSPIILAVAAALLGPLGAYIVAARRMSGKIATSDASDLWKESAAIRTSLQLRNEQLQGVITKYQARLDAAEARITQLEELHMNMYLENGNLKRMVENHEATITSLTSQVNRLSRENTALKSENTKLRKRVAELEAPHE